MSACITNCILFTKEEKGEQMTINASISGTSIISSILGFGGGDDEKGKGKKRKEKGQVDTATV